MRDKILVAYAGKYGATKEIAETVGRVFSDADLDVDVLPVKSVDGPAPYSHVVIGSAAYIGMWRKDAVKFIKKFKNILSAKKVWLFSSGPTGEGDPVKLAQGWKYPKKLQPEIDEIRPVDIAVFHGSIDKKKLTFIEKFMIDKVEAPVGDFRDWQAIEKWAKGIISAL